MNKAFLFARTDVVVAHDDEDFSDVEPTVTTALDRTVIVTTPAITGAGAIVGDKVVTSLLLVANYKQVSIRFCRGKKMSAFVTRRDQKRNLAELLPSSRILSVHHHTPLASTKNPKPGGAMSVGEPLLVVDVAIGVPSVRVASTLYGTTLAERFEEKWRINSHAPRGVIGGGVWDIEGKFAGLAIGERISPPNDMTRRLFPSVYALPGVEVMNFVESS